MPTWIDTLEARRAIAAEPKSPEELQAATPAAPAPAVSHADMAALVRDEVGTQMESFMSRLEGLFAPHTPSAPAVPATATAGTVAPSSPWPAQTAPTPAESPAAVPTGGNPPETAGGADSAAAPA